MAQRARRGYISGGAGVTLRSRGYLSGHRGMSAGGRGRRAFTPPSSARAGPGSRPLARQLSTQPRGRRSMRPRACAADRLRRPAEILEPLRRCILTQFSRTLTSFRVPEGRVTRSNGLAATFATPVPRHVNSSIYCVPSPRYRILP